VSEVRDIQEPFAKWLDSEKIPYVRPRSDMESTIRKGWVDFTIIYRSSALMIETKDKDTPLTKEQKQVHAELEATGTPVLVLRNLAECVEAVRQWRDSGFVVRRAGGSVQSEEWAVAQDGTNGDFLYRKTGPHTWAKNRRATLDDLGRYRRIKISNKAHHAE
jgi:hypothetical protein